MSGVRNSWLTVERKSLFRRSSSSSRALAFSSSVGAPGDLFLHGVAVCLHLGVELGIDRSHGELVGQGREQLDELVGEVHGTTGGDRP